MTTQAQSASLYRVAVGTAAAVIIIWGMQLASSFLSTILLALVLTIAITPVMFWFQRKGLPGWAALVLTMVLVVVGFILVVVLLGVSIGQLVQALPEYEHELEELFESSEDLLAELGVDTSDVFALDFLDPSRLVEASAAFLISIVGTLGASVMLLLIMAFMLLEATGFPIKVNRRLPRDSLLLRNMSEFGSDIREYVFITTWTGLLAAGLDVILLMFLGVDFAVMWGLVAFFLSFVPNIGFVLALIPPTVLALLEHGWVTALLVVIGYCVINGAVDSVMKPRIMGKGLNLSPLVVMLSLIFWAWVLGPLGAILAVPLTMMVKKLVLESNEGTRLVADLIGSGVEEEDDKVVAGDVAAAPGGTTD